eukprot:352412-Chlamydomonas_euryale.AAC.2
MLGYSRGVVLEARAASFGGVLLQAQGVSIQGALPAAQRWLTRGRPSRPWWRLLPTMLSRPPRPLSPPSPGKPHLDLELLDDLLGDLHVVRHATLQLPFWRIPRLHAAGPSTAARAFPVAGRVLQMRLKSITSVPLTAYCVASKRDLLYMPVCLPACLPACKQYMHEGPRAFTLM